MFIEGAVANSQVRKLSGEEMNAYRSPFARSPADRIPTFKWPNEIPIAGSPVDVAHAWAAWEAFMLENDLPKLLLKGEPGAIVDEDTYIWLRERLKSTTFVNVGPGKHYLQEDNPHGIGHAITDWIQAHNWPPTGSFRCTPRSAQTAKKKQRKHHGLEERLGCSFYGYGKYLGDRGPIST